MLVGQRFDLREILEEVTNWRHLAVALGPNHSPGCLPHASAPCSTNLWMLKGASGESANSESMSLCSAFDWPSLQSRPSFSATRAFASRVCPLLIMQPHPVSLEKPA